MPKPEIPVIVASLQILNQSVDFPQAAIFTPSVDGTFRLSIYGENTPNTGSNLSVIVDWTSDLGNEELVTSGFASGVNVGAVGKVVLIRLKANQLVEDMN